MGFKILSTGATPVPLAFERNGTAGTMSLPPELAGRDFLLDLSGVVSMSRAEKTDLLRLDSDVRAQGGVLVSHSLSRELLNEFHEAGLGAQLIGAENETKALRIAQKFHDLAGEGAIPMPPEGYAAMIEVQDSEYRELVKLLPPAPPGLEAEIAAALAGPRTSMAELLAELAREGECLDE